MDRRVREVVRCLDAYVEELLAAAAKKPEIEMPRPPSIEELAARSNSGVSTLYIRMKAEGIPSPRLYIRQKQMERARELAENTFLKGHEIREAVGEEDDRNFRRWFKEVNGCTLTACRHELERRADEEAEAAQRKANVGRGKRQSGAAPVLRRARGLAAAH